MKLDQDEDLLGSTTLLYGEPKTGKTEMAGRLAEYFKIIWFDLENGSRTLRTRIPKIYHPNIELIKIPDSRTNPVAIDTLLKVYTGAPVNICNAHGIIGCAQCSKIPGSQTRICLNELNKEEHLVVTDGLSQLTDSAYAKIAGGDPVYKFEWDDWFKMNQLLAMVLSAQQQAKYNSLFITHEVEAEGEDNVKRLYPLAGTKPFSAKVAKYFSNVIYMRVRMKQFEQGATQDFAINVVAGNRNGLTLGNGVQLIDLIRDHKAEMTVEEFEKIKLGQKNVLVPGAKNTVNNVIQQANNLVKEIPNQLSQGDKLKMLLKKEPVKEIKNEEVKENVQPESTKPITLTEADKNKPQVIRTPAEILKDKLAQAKVVTSN